LGRENEELRRKLTEAENNVAERDKKIAERDKKIAERDKKIADLERQLAARRQNSTNSSKPPSSDGLAKHGCAGVGKEAGASPADRRVTPARTAPWSRRNKSITSKTCCRSSAGIVIRLCRTNSTRCGRREQSSGIRSRSCRR